MFCKESVYLNTEPTGLIEKVVKSSRVEILTFAKGISLKSKKNSRILKTISRTCFEIS